MTSTVTGRNQVTIPAELARDLGIKAGTKLEWEKTRDGALKAKLLPTRGELARAIRGAGRKLPGYRGRAVEALLREREKDLAVESHQ